MFDVLKYNKTKDFLFYLFLIIIFITGICIRIKFYLTQAPMWIDEIMLASNFIDRSFTDLFQPLDAFQKAPPLFFLAVITIRKIFGANELTLRFIPFLLNIASLFAFFLLLKDNIKNKLGILTGLSIFTFGVPLIYFCAEFKPYGCDVFFCIILLLISKYHKFSELNIKQTIIYTIAAVIFVFSSFPTIFIIPAIILSELIKDKKFDPKILWIFAGIFIAGITLFLYDIQNYIFLKGYWGKVEGGFSLIPSFEFIKSFVFNACKYYVYNFNPEYTIPLVCIILTGFIVLAKENKNKAFLIVFIILFALISSSLNAYPLNPKLALYMAPIFILLIAKVFDITSYFNSPKPKLIFNILACLILIFILRINIPYINMSGNDLIYYNKASHGRDKSIDDRNTVKDYCLKIIKNAQPEDIIIASKEFVLNIKCYKGFYKYNKPLNVISYAKISEKNLSDSDMENLIIKNINRHNNSSSNIWLIGRNNEKYFKCLNLDQTENIINKYNLKYDKYTHKDIYLIRTHLR